MRKWLWAFALALSATGFATTAVAAPILWTIPETALDQGGVVSGSFVYDPETDSYSAVSISTTAGTVGDAATFRLICTDPDCLFPTLPGFWLSLTASAFTGDMTGSKFLALVAFEGLLEQNTSPHFLLITATCIDAACTVEPPDLRFAEGLLTGTPYVAPVPPITPVPTLGHLSLTLMSLALGGFAFLRRKA